MRKSMTLSLSVLMLFAISTSQVLAGTAADWAEKHFSAIGAGDTTTLQNQYAQGAVFQWVGGPLDGTYNGADEISGLWHKFTKVQGKLDVKVMSMEENSNSKGATITAAVRFMGKKPIPVRYVLVYRENKLVNEIWQIAPNLKADNSY